MFHRIKDAQIEAGKVWNLCRDLHLNARKHSHAWPTKQDLQVGTKGLFALHSQTVQMICHGFIANVETTKQLRKSYPEMKMKYPWRDKTFRPLVWPKQAITYQHGRVVLPMGRGRKSLTFKIELPEQFGSIKLVWNGGYELHVCYGDQTPQPLSSLQHQQQGKACVDLGEIHQATVVCDSGKALVVSGRGIRSLKQGRAKTYGDIQKLKSRCKKGSRRFRKLCRAMGAISGRVERRIRDGRHKGTRKIVDFCKAEGVTTVFVGDPHGVRNNKCGRKHNQRMSGWEYGKDTQYIKEKCDKASMESFTGSERGTSSQCPACGNKQKVRGRVWSCRKCTFIGHRDVVGGVNMFPLAFGSKVMFPALITYLRASPVRGARRVNNLVHAQALTRSSRADSPHGCKSMLSDCVAIASTARECGSRKGLPRIAIEIRSSSPVGD
jgi:putative transposase